jgi:ubiquinone/menaquinone biosynthesis C-methylase UbiE
MLWNRISAMPAAEHTANYRILLDRYADYASNYDRRWGRYSAATLAKALEWIPSEDATLLDVACGTGLLAAMLKQHRPRVRIIGVDITPQMLEQAKQRIPPGAGVDWRLGQAENLPVDDASVDVLTCTNAFHLVQNSQAALAEFTRVLKPGCPLIIVDWCLDFPMMKLRDAVLQVLGRQRRRIRGLGEFLDELQRAGLAIEHADRFRAARWGLMRVVARKAPPIHRDPQGRRLTTQTA